MVKGKLFLFVIILTLSIILPSVLPVAAAASGYPLSQSDARVQAALDYFRNSSNAQSVLWNSMEKACYAIVAIEACGADAHTFTNSSGTSLIDVIRENAPSFLKSQASASLAHEYYLMAIVAAGENPGNFAGIDVRQQLKDMFDGTQVGMPGIINDDFWAIISLVGAGESPSSEIIRKSKDHIIANQSPDGGWGSVTGGTGSDPCDTANAIMALRAAGVSVSSAPIQAGLAYLKSTQQSDGGFPYEDGYSSDSASDARVIGALRACGIDPTSATWSVDGKNAVSHALSLQQPDGGFAWYSGGSSDPWMTSYILPALVGKHWPPDLFSGGGSSSSSSSSSSSGSSSGSSGTTPAAVPAGDITAPAIDTCSPSSSENATPVISAYFSDAGSGIDINAVVLKVDGTDVTSQAVVEVDRITYTPVTPLRNGTHMAELLVYDRRGNRARAAWNFRIQAPFTAGLPPDEAPVDVPDDGSIPNTPSLNEEGDITGQVAGMDAATPGTIINPADFCDASGTLNSDLVLETPDSLKRLTILQGAILTGPGGSIVDRLTVMSPDRTPVLTGGYCRIGTACEIGPDSVTLDGPAMLAFTYEEMKNRESVRWDTNGDGAIDFLDNEIVISPDDLAIARYDVASSRWVPIDSIVDKEMKKVTAQIGHISLFALIAPVARPLTVLGIQALPESSELGQETIITVTVENPGTSNGLYFIPFKIDGVLETSREVTLGPGDHEIVFIHKEPYTGAHQVDVFGKSAEFTVHEASAEQGNWWDSVDIVFYLYIIIGVACIAVIIGSILVSRMLHRRRTP